jgi:hypothetical protein
MGAYYIRMVGPFATLKRLSEWRICTPLIPDDLQGMIHLHYERLCARPADHSGRRDAGVHQGRGSTGWAEFGAFLIYRYYVDAVLFTA